MATDANHESLAMSSFLNYELRSLLPALRVLRIANWYKLVLDEARIPRASCSWECQVNANQK